MSKICELLSQLAATNRAINAENEAIEGYRLKITEAEAALNKQTAAIEEQKEAGKLKRREAQKLEGEIGSFEKKIGDATANQAQASNNDDYATWTKRIEEHRNAVAELEESVLELLEACDRADAENLTLNEEITALKSKTKEQKDDYSSSIDSSTGRIDELVTRRDTLLSQLGPSFKGFYERLYAKYSEDTVVPIKKESCGGCYMKLTVETVAKVRTSEDPVTCMSCNRILYSLPATS